MSKAKIICYFLWLQIVNGGRKAVLRKADYLRKKGVFKNYGQGGYWHPLNIPSFPNLISIGDNVTVCADVKFYEHDIIHRMWNEDKQYEGPHIGQYEGKIIVEDNVVIGGNSIILYDVCIGKNSVVAAGSVVTKNVEPYSIVGGNPAKKIGDTRTLYNKRFQYTENLKKGKE